MIDIIIYHHLFNFELNNITRNIIKKLIIAHVSGYNNTKTDGIKKRINNLITTFISSLIFLHLLLTII